jgi:hypothetical protein
MSETNGIVIVKCTPELEINQNCEDSFINSFLTTLNLKEDRSDSPFYSIFDKHFENNYIGIEVFGSEWENLSKKILQSSTDVEYYASLYSEYGIQMYFGKRENGITFYYSYEDDGGDESVQDSFDISSYKENLETKEAKWLELLPDDVKNSFKAILPKQPDFIKWHTISVSKEVSSVPVSDDSFMGKVDGVYLHSNGYLLVERAIESIKNNEFDKFNKALDEAKFYPCGYEIIQEVEEFLTCSKEGKVVSEENIKPFCESIIKKYKKFLLSKSRMSGGMGGVITSRELFPSSYIYMESLIKEYEKNPYDISLKQAITSCARCDQLTTLKLLLGIEQYKNKKDFNEVLLNAISLAVYTQSKQVVKYLIPLIPQEKCSAVFNSAAEKGDYETINKLIDNKHTFDPDYNDLFENSMESGSSRTIDILLSQGMNIPTKNQILSSCLQGILASTKNNLHQPIETIEIFKVLEKHSPNFWNSVERKNILIDVAISRGTDTWVNITNKDSIDKSKEGYSKLALIHSLLDKFLKEVENGDEFNKLLLSACGGVMPLAFEKVQSIYLEKFPDTYNLESIIKEADNEARIYILGSRKFSNEIIKINILRILKLLDSDRSDFPPELIKKSDDFNYKEVKEKLSQEKLS